MPVRCVGELDPEHLGILLGLLYTLARGNVLGLSFDNCYAKIACIAQEIIRTALAHSLRFAT